MWADTSLFSTLALMLVLRHLCYVGRHVSIQYCTIPLGTYCAVSVTPPTQHTVLSEGVIFFPVYYKLINFKLVHSYNVKHLTCSIFCSSGLKNIYKLHIWKCSTFTIFTLLTKETKMHIH